MLAARTSRIRPIIMLLLAADSPVSGNPSGTVVPAVPVRFVAVVAGDMVVPAVPVRVVAAALAAAALAAAALAAALAAAAVGVLVQIPFVMVLVSSVTSPFRANNCPCTVAPVCAAMDVFAKMCPTK